MKLKQLLIILLTVTMILSGCGGSDVPDDLESEIESMSIAEESEDLEEEPEEEPFEGFSPEDFLENVLVLAEELAQNDEHDFQEAKSSSEVQRSDDNARDYVVELPQAKMHFLTSPTGQVQTVTAVLPNDDLKDCYLSAMLMSLSDSIDEKEARDAVEALTADETSQQVSNCVVSVVSLEQDYVYAIVGTTAFNEDSFYEERIDATSLDLLLYASAGSGEAAPEVSQPEPSPSQASTSESASSSTSEVSSSSVAEPESSAVAEGPGGTNFTGTYYVTKSGKKYHYLNPCGNGTYYAATWGEVQRRGLGPCEKCAY